MGIKHGKQQSFRTEQSLNPNICHLNIEAQPLPQHLSLHETEKTPNLAHTALIFQMLFEHLNFCTSISARSRALINGPHLSRHHVARRPCPARQLCFRIMAALHPSVYHAMIVHLCDPSVKLLCQKGQQGTVQGKPFGNKERLQHHHLCTVFKHILS